MLQKNERTDIGPVTCVRLSTLNCQYLVISKTKIRAIEDASKERDRTNVIATQM